MSDERILKQVDRRSFLRGSAIFAAALGIGVVAPAFAQEEPKPNQPKPEEEKKDEKKEPGTGSDKETKIDEDGREYRVCPQCAANMYKQGRTWTCENCGYSYVE
jgi:predicted RNA-binding Zn-ribbon protein involved in translation (DUF1610 family)